jgi:hypothetical protein
MTDLYKFRDRVVGPFEINSEGTDWWLPVFEIDGTDRVVVYRIMHRREAYR